MSIEGHDQPCYYCGLPCNNLIGSPSMWSIPLCHNDEPGVVRWHHTGCVSLRLHKLELLEKAISKITEAEQQYNKHTMAYMKAVTGYKDEQRINDSNGNI